MVMNTDPIGRFDEPAFRSLRNSARPGENAQQQDHQYGSHILPQANAGQKVSDSHMGHKDIVLVRKTPHQLGHSSLPEKKRKGSTGIFRMPY
jgi:hypothetical protein